MRLFVVACALLTLFPKLAIQANELDCLREEEKQTEMLYARLQQQAYDALDRRAERLAEVKSVAQINDHQKRLREFFIRQLGGFPDKTALNARTVKTIQADGYRIENVIFESRPHHHITANLYLPDGAAAAPSQRVPAIAVSSGHSRTAKTADYNQRFGIVMARQGMAALCFDPIGQGERSQILGDDGQPAFSGTTTEHMLIGVGSTLVGRNTASYRVWDGMRAIDYLCSRPEIDPDRIGFTGCSGGGTMTSYVMALDDRVACAAPACYLTTFRRLIETIGPQDAEQNIFAQLAFGMDQPDYVIMRAPRPTLISSTTDDFFDSRGSWENFRQAKQIYGRLGFPERVDLVEVEGKHGVQPQNLATIAHWMQRWLLERDEPVTAVELETRPAADLLCTETGQVLTSIENEKSVLDLNAEYERTLAGQRSKAWQDIGEAERRQRVREVLRLRPEEELQEPAWEDRGRVEREDYHIDKVVLTTSFGRKIPGLTFHPASPADAAYLVLHDEGKLGDSQPGGPVESLMMRGNAVVTIDLAGQGETAFGPQDATLTNWKTFYLAYLLGHSLVGLRVEDTLAAADFVTYYQKDREHARPVHLVASGHACIVALHAAAVHPDLFASVTLNQMPESWSSVVQDPSPTGQLSSAIHGVLGSYDLPNLIELVGKDKVSLVD
jgi:cephalosporin-C deacetylase-like acetyl esterase